MAKSLFGEVNFLGLTLRPSFAVLYTLEAISGKEVKGLVAAAVQTRFPLRRTALRFLVQGLGYTRQEADEIHSANLGQLPGICWDDLFKVATGFMGKSTDEFWRMTMHEFLLAYEGFCMLHDIKLAPYGTPATQHDVRSMMRQFPDRGNNL